MSELWVGSTTALPMPEPERTSASITTVVAMPVKREKRPHAIAPMIAMRTRLLRSAYQAIGTWSASAPRLTTAMRVRRALQPEVERVADLGQQDAEGGAVELVHRVEPEQHDDGVDGAVAGEPAQPPARVTNPPQEGRGHGAVPAGTGAGGSCSRGSGGGACRPAGSGR